MRRTLTMLFAAALLVVGLAACQPQANPVEVSIAKQGMARHGWHDASCMPSTGDLGNRIRCTGTMNGQAVGGWSTALTRTADGKGGQIRMGYSQSGFRDTTVTISHRNFKVTKVVTSY